MDVKNLTDTQRLAGLRVLLSEIAAGIRSAQQALPDSDGSTDTVYLVTSTLGRLGWMADQGCVLAGDECPPAVGEAHAWLLSPEVLEVLGAA